MWCVYVTCLVACTFAKTLWTSFTSIVHVEPMYESDECSINYITYHNMNIKAQAVFRCGPHRKLGEPEPRSGVGFKMLIMENNRHICLPHTYSSMMQPNNFTDL
jgi:hypothetical protein